LPAGAFITAGLGTNTIDINWGTAAAGIYTINVSATNSCGNSPTNSIVITIIAPPAQPGVIAVPSPLCAGQAANFSVVPVVGAVSYDWISSCAWTGASTTENIIFTPTVGGPCLVSVRSVNTCGVSSFRTVVLTPSDVPAQPDPINGLTRVCVGSTQTYSVRAVPGVTYNWTGVPAGASVVGPSNSNQITINWGTAAVGPYTLTLDPSNACGAGTPQTITVDVVNAPTAVGPIQGPTTICRGGTGQYSIPPVANTTFTWSVTPSAGVVINASGNLAEILFLNVGSYTVDVVRSNECGIGTSSQTQVTVTAPPVVTVPVQQIVCANNPNISASGTPAGGAWTCVSCPGGAAITGAGLVSGLSIPGERYVFRYTFTDAVCPSQFAETAVLYGIAQGGAVGASATVCAGSNGLLQLTGQIGEVVRWERSTDCIAYSPIVNQTPTFTYINVQQTTCFRAVVRNDATCPEVFSAPATVIVISREIASSSPSVLSTCTNDINLLGNNPAGYTGSWMYISGALPSVVLTNLAGGQATVTGLTNPGNYIFRFTLTNATCGTTSTDVVVKRSPAVSVANAGLDRTICLSNTTLTGNRPAIGTGTWSYIGGTGASLPSVSTVAQQFGLVTGMDLPGSYIFEWRITSTDCPLSPTFDQVVIIREESPTPADAGADQTICAADVLLTGNNPLVGTSTWSFSSGPVTPVLNVFGNSVNVTGMTMPGVYLFGYGISNGVCPPSVDQVRITVVSNPSAATVPKLEYRVCEAQGLVLRANMPTIGMGTWSLVSSPGASVPTVTTVGTDGFVSGMTDYGQYEFAWTVRNMPCATATTATVRVIRDREVPGTPTASPNVKVCLGTPVSVTGSVAPTGYTGQWVYVSGPVSNTTITTIGTIGNITNLNESGFYIFEWRVSGPVNTACPVKSAAVVVEVEDAPTVANAGPDQVICGDRAILTGNVPFFGTGLWTVRTFPVGATPSLVGNGPSVDAVNLTLDGVYTFRYTVTNGTGCPPSFDEMAVTISRPTTGGFVSADANHCIGSANGTLMLSGQVGTVVRWEGSAGNFAPGTVTVLPGGTPMINYSGLTTTTQYRAIIRNGSCGEVPSTSARITVNQLPTPANAGPDQFFCGSSFGSVTLSGNIPTVGSGSWTFGAGPTSPTIFSLGNNALVTGFTLPGTYTIIYSITNGNCPPSVDAVNIIVAPASVGGFVSASATVCEGTNSGTLSVFGQTGNVTRWESTTSNFTPGNITAFPGAPTFSYVGLTQTTRFRAIVQNGTCPEAISGEVVITVTPRPTVANAGPDLQFCGSPTTVPLTGNTPTVGTGSWVLVSQPSGGSASIAGSGPSATLVNPSIEGVYVAEWRISNGPCPISSDQVQIQVFNNSGGGTVMSSATVCSGTNAGTLSLTGQKGTIQRWESSTNNFLPGFITVIPNTLTNLSYSGLTQTTQYRAIVKAGACPEAASTVATISVQPVGTIASAGANQILCGSQVQLTGNAPVVGTGLWTYVTGPQSPALISFNPTPPSSNFVTISNLIPSGTYVFRWTITNGVCGSSSSDVFITRLNDVPVANAGPDRLICTSNLTINGNNPAPGVGTWSYVSGPSSTTANINTSVSGVASVSGLLDAGVHVLRYEITNAPCPATSDEVNITVTKPVTTPTVPNSVVRVCGQSTATISADVPPFGTGTWTFVSSSNADPASISTGGPSGTLGDVTGMDLTGEYRFRYTITNAPCSGSSSVDVRVFRDAPLTASPFAGADQEYCDRDYALLSGNTPPAGVTALWERVSFPPLADPQVVSFGQFGSVVDMSVEGTYCFRYTFQSNTSCGNSSDIVCVTTWDRPTVATAGPSQSICTPIVTLTGNTPTKGTGMWSFVTGPPSITPTIGNPLTTVSTMSGMNVGGTYVYRWAISNGACTPSAFDVTIQVNEGTIGGTVVGATTVCAGSNSGAVSLTGSRGTVLDWCSSTNNFATCDAIANTGMTQPFSNLTTTTCYRARVKDGSCAEAFSSSVCVTVLGAPTASSAGTTQQVCGTNTTLAANAATSGTGMWSVVSVPPSGSPVISPMNSPTATVTNLTVAGDYILRWTITNAPCGTSESSVLIKVTPSVSGGTASGDATVCSGSNSGTVNLTGATGNVIRWERSTDPTFVPVTPLSNTGMVQGYSNLTQTTYFRAVVGGGGCPNAFSSTAAITVVPGASANAGSDQTLCATNTTVIGNLAPGFSGNWSIVTRPAGGNGTTVSTDALTGAGSVNNLVAGTYLLRWTLSGGACGSVSDDAILVVGTGAGGGTMSGSATVCSGPNVGTLTITGFSGTVLRWESASDPGFITNLINHNNPTSSFTYFSLTSTRFYRAVVDGGGSCGTYFVGTGIITVVGPAANVTAGGSQTVCESRVSLSGSVPVNGGSGMWTYVLGPEASGNIIIAQNSPTAGQAVVDGINAIGNYLFRYTVDYGPCGVRTSDVLITRRPTVGAGVATANPAMVCAGVNSSMIMLAGNNQPIIGWEMSTNPAFTPSTPIVNTSSVLNVSNLSQTMYYRAVVQGPFCGPRFSASAAVEVSQPSVGGTTAGAATVCSGTNSGSVSLSGNVGNVVRWETSLSPTFTPATPSPATTLSLNYASLTQTTYYRAVVKNGACAEVFSAPVAVMVVGPSFAGTITGNFRVCSGIGSTTLILTGNNCDVVRWESSIDGFLNFATLSNPTATLTVSGLTASRAYRAVVKCGPCAEASSAPIVVDVDQVSQGGTLAGNATVCPGTNTGTLTLSGQFGQVVQWESADNAAFIGATTLNNVSTSQLYSNLSSTTFYRVLVKNGSCSGVYSSTATIQVNSSVSGGTLSGGGTVCGGSNNGTLTLVGNSGSVIRWEMSANPTFAPATPITNTLTNLSYSNLTATTYYRAVVGDGNCPTVFSSVVEVAVVAPSAAGTVTGASSSCITTANGSLSLSGQTGTFLRWERSTNSNFSPMTTLSPMNPLPYSETSTTFYRAVVQNGVCNAVSGTPIEIRVDQAASGGSVSGNATVCSGNNNGSLNLTGQFGSVVRWESSATSNFSPLTTISNVSSSLSYSNVSATTFYRAVVQNGACPPVFSSVGMVTVNQAPSLMATAVVVCDGSGTVVGMASGGTAPYLYVLNPGNRVSSTGEFTSVTPGSYTVSVTDAIGCGASQQSVFVGTTPTPLVLSTVQNVTQNSAVVTWPSARSANAVYTLRFRVKGSSVWTVINSITTTFRQLTGLQNNTVYEVQIDYRCAPASDAVGFGPSTEFRTLSMGLCSEANLSNVPIPGGIFVDNITSFSSRVNWNSVPDAAGYIISWGIANSNPNGWPQDVICNPTTQYTISGLVSGITYEVRVRTNCTNCTTASQSFDKRSVFSMNFAFTTNSFKSLSSVETVNNGGLTVYPNPNRGQFSVRYTSATAGNLQLMLLDASGREIQTQVLEVNAGENDLPVVLENISPGLYLLRVSGSGIHETIKLMVE